VAVSNAPRARYFLPSLPGLCLYPFLTCRRNLAGARCSVAVAASFWLPRGWQPSNAVLVSAVTLLFWFGIRRPQPRSVPVSRSRITCLLPRRSGSRGTLRRTPLFNAAQRFAAAQVCILTRASTLRDQRHRASCQRCKPAACAFNCLRLRDAGNSAKRCWFSCR